MLPPKITSTSHKAVIEWKIKRREYEAELRARCRVSGEDYDAVLTPVKESFDADLLDSFCELKLVIPSRDVTEGMLTTELEHIASSVMNGQLPDIKGLFKAQLRMNMLEDDVDARVLDYFNQFVKIMRDHGLTHCFEDLEGERSKCKRLVASLYPAALQDEPAAKDTRLLFELVVKKAKDYERHFQRQKKKRDQSVQDKDTAKPFRLQEKKRSWQSNSPKPPTAGTTRTVVEPGPLFKQAFKQAPRQNVWTGAKPPPSPCPKCNEMHWIRDCPSSTEAEKIELRKNMVAKRARLKRPGETLPVSSRKVTINGVLQLPYCPDSGSDHTIIGRSHWEQLLLKDPSVEAEVLPTTVENLPFGSVSVTARTKTQLHLLIHTAAGPVEPVSAVEVLIVDVDDDEFIIGNDLLTALGIDISRQLEMLASRGEDETSGDTIVLEADDLPVTLDDHAPTRDDIFAAVEKTVTRAVENGFPLDKMEQLRKIVLAYDVWRLELQDDPPARVPPLEVRLKDGARPTKCKPRKYPPHIRQFLHEFNARLVELGLVYENPDSRWASPVLSVKKSSDLMDFRQTTDYHAVNGLTDEMAAVMPILSQVMENARGMKHFGLFDFLKGFWQLPLADHCQEFLSYMTDEKVFTPRRVLQGSSDAAIYFQKTMENCFASLLYKHLLVWIDDLLLYAVDIDTYMMKLEGLFSPLNEFGLKLSAKKSSLYQTQVKWCGRVIDRQGVRHDPARIDTLRSLPYPTTAGELQQFVCAINWMRESIIDFPRLVGSLQCRLDAALAHTKRTRRAAASIAIDLTADERQAFEQVKEAIATSATLDFPNDDSTTCLFTDASDVGWAVIVTQVADFDSKRPATDQQHRLIHCMSGTFSGSQLNWTVIEKEAFPIVLACDKVDYLLLRPKPFRMYCDHRNLIHVFAPHESVKKHIRGKLLRWAMKLINHRYVVEHVPGPDNVWADMISRWAGNHAPTVTTTRLKAIRGRPAATTTAGTNLRPLDEPTFVWPTLAELRDAQSKFLPPPGAATDSDDLVIMDGRLWIPPDATALLQRLCIVAHCGARGHRGQIAIFTHLRRLFSIENVAAVVARFVKNCLLCLHSRGGKVIPRPWSAVLDCSTRNVVLHFDYLYLGESYGSSKYLLVLKDHATHFCELVVADTAESQVVTEALLAWHSRFGIPPTWVSDQGTHFLNEVVAELRRRLKTQQTFTPAYCPWINGSIERVNREILQVVRAMILAYKISYKDWVYLVPIIQSNLNHTAVPSLGNRAPIELFTGLECRTPLMEFYLPDTGKLQEIPPNDQVDRYLGENLVNFTVGDYVLRSRIDEKHSNKLQVTWVGPYRVVRADAHSFRVQNLITEDEVDVHASWLKMYADDNLNVTDELLEHIAAQGIVVAVEELKAHRWNESIRDVEICVSWKGLQSIEDSYEPMTHLAAEIRILVEKYVATANDPALTEYWNTIRRPSTETSPVAPAPRAAAEQRPRAPQNAGDPALRPRKRRRRSAREPEDGASQNTAAPAQVLPAARQLRTRRAPDESSQQHTSAESHDSQLTLGRIVPDLRLRLLLEPRRASQLIDSADRNVNSRKNCE